MPEDPNWGQGTSQQLVGVLSTQFKVVNALQRQLTDDNSSVGRIVSGQTKDTAIALGVAIDKLIALVDAT